MTAQDYPITFPYGATSSPYSAASPHRGDDHPCPEGTALVIGGTQLGLTGQTGKANGPHLHIQEWHGDYANTRKPQNAFVGGTVTNIDLNGTQGDGSFGKFITVQTSDGWNDSYCHLSRIDVKIGDKVGTMTPATCPADEQFVRFCYNAELFRDANASEAQSRVGQTCLTVVTSIMSSQEWKDIQYRQADYPRLAKEFEDYKKANPPGGGGNCTKDERDYLDLLKKVTK